MRFFISLSLNDVKQATSIDDCLIDEGVDQFSVLPAKRSWRVCHPHHCQFLARVCPPIGAGRARPVEVSDRAHQSDYPRRGADREPETKSVQCVGSLFRECTPPSLVFVLPVSDGAFYPQLPRSEPCKMAQDNYECAPAQTGSVICCTLEAVDIECRPLRVRRALKTRKETMSGIWRSPVLKPKSAIRSGQRTTTSTPNIILDRCHRTQKGRKSHTLWRGEGT